MVFTPTIKCREGLKVCDRAKKHTRLESNSKICSVIHAYRLTRQFAWIVGFKGIDISTIQRNKEIVTI